ncbi:MAG: TauD/TfdA family dioxygenase [Spirochaetaceae bacterium]|nr:TauD/TfdA family dioxygenase [Myxococcales bacterium]MCB9722477.1 TauD/TfdA family dioxygenase [Spirochaetaceae bacterium]HPG26210.1 TauD/TfdA family dioxygenase [Myxococcota bacterium]
MSDDLQIRELSGALGAEIRGLDLSRPLSEGTRKAFLDAFHRYGVLCIRDQKLTHEAHIALARTFGDPDVHPIAKGMESHPEIIRVLKPAGERAFFGTSWHTDNSFFERPSSVTVLYGEKVPPVGGDTLYASMERAWELLSEPLKRFLEPLRAVHSAREAYDPKTTGDAKYRGDAPIQYVFSDAIYAEVEHPVVRTHPVTGRKSLYVNPMFTDRIVGLSKPESDGLLAMLFDVSTRPELTCRVRWENGTVTIWDNRWLQHYAIDDYADHERLMYRVTITGERPV